MNLTVSLTVPAIKTFIQNMSDEFSFSPTVHSMNHVYQTVVQLVMQEQTSEL